MTKKLYVFPYNSASASAKELSKNLGPLLRRENSKFVTATNKVVINWGNSQLSNMPSQVQLSLMVNIPHFVGLMSNKLKFFIQMDNYNSNVLPSETVNIPKFFNNFQSAHQHWLDNGGAWVARKVLNGHSGEGIVILETIEDWTAFEGTPCNLFVQYIKKSSEYRLHFRDFSTFSTGNPDLGAKVFFVQRKACPTGVNPATFKVRNHQNGFIFVNDGGNLEAPEAVTHAANTFLKANHGMLNFGALDIIYNKKYNKAYVLEVNTAPGLTGLTIDKYVEQFKLLEALA